MLTLYCTPKGRALLAAWIKKDGVAGPATPHVLGRTLGAQVSFGVPVLLKGSRHEPKPIFNRVLSGALPHFSRRESDLDRVFY
jgi:hypothetical protein